MAYVNQELKARIKAALKPIMPADWKWSLAVRNHSTIVLTISAAPADLLGEIERCAQANAEREGRQNYFRKDGGHADLNVYHFRRALDEHVELFARIIDALNTDNFDNSDLMSDYHHVGHYVTVQIGRWDKAFICTQGGAQ